MFFLFRCLFWLGLVFSQIASLEGGSLFSLAGQRAQQASESAVGLGQAAMTEAGRQRRAEAEKCLAIAAQAARLAQVANPNRLSQAANPSRLSQAANPSRDTLTAGDRAPAWRLRSATIEGERRG
jgi:hypothetical protein